jgi:exodeoxyribonuclease-3
MVARRKIRADRMEHPWHRRDAIGIVRLDSPRRFRKLQPLLRQRELASAPTSGIFPGVKLISWNVNGLRAVLKKNFLEYLGAEKPDALCLQETKCAPDDVEQLWPAHYTTYWNSAEKKGYSGTAIFSKARPVGVTPHLGISEHDREGRVLAAEYEDFFLVNVYTPNSKRELERLPYRQVWDKDFLAYLKKLEKKKPVICCGDLNVAHTEIDLANPKANVRNHGFTIEERDGFSAFVNAGFVDTFREFEKGGGHYSWWSPMGGARARNVGWRIDYFLISRSLRPRLKTAFIRREIPGSDHCPVGIELK